MTLDKNNKSSHFLNFVVSLSWLSWVDRGDEDDAENDGEDRGQHVVGHSSTADLEGENIRY